MNLNLRHKLLAIALCGMIAGVMASPSTAVETLSRGLVRVGGLILNGTTITATGAELNTVDVTAGTVTASKAAVVDSNKDIGDFRNVDVVNLDAGASATAGTVDIFPTTASKGKLSLTAADSAGDTTTTIVNASQSGARTYTIPDAGASGSFLLTTGTATSTTATTAEISKLALAPFLVSTVSTTPASGSCAAQFEVRNAAGTAVAEPVTLRAYLSSSATGLTHTAAGTSIAVLTNGALTTDGATPLIGPHFTLTTTAAGLIGLTLTSGAGTYYIAFVMPNGKLVMSSALVVN